MLLMRGVSQCTAGDLVHRSVGILLLLALTGPVTAQVPATDSTLSFPAPTGWVADYATVLSDSARSLLTELSEEVRRACLGEIVVVTVPSLYGRDARVVARNLGRQWGVGADGPPSDPATNTGVLLLLAPNDGQVALELGIGTNRFISDEDAGQVLDSLVLPALIRKEWERGVLAGAWAVAERFAARFGFALPGRKALYQGE